MAQKATPEPKGWADVRKAAAQAAVKASEKTGRPVDERVKKLAESSLNPHPSAVEPYTYAAIGATATRKIRTSFAVA